MALKPLELIIRARDEASGVLRGFNARLTAIGLAIASYFGITAFAGAVKGAADLESALSEVKAVSGATADEMVRMRAAAEDAGATTKYTATEAATSLGNLARAGLSAGEAIAALPPTLQLASAGGIALEDSATIVTRALAGFNLKATQAGRVADVLAQGANASNTSVRGLAEALSYAAPTARSLGLSLEDTVAIIGKFADAGIDASRAGTALNGILAQFSDPASTFKRELSDIGITTSDFNKALSQLAAAGPAGQKAIAAVGLEAGPALKALLGQGIGALDDLRAKLNAAHGSATATAATMSDNLNGSIKGLGSAWDTVKNALATPVLPVLKAGVDSLTASFQSAVSSGVVGRFGQAIATGFESAITWAKAFAAQVDFEALAVTLRGYADQAGQAFTDIKNAATTAGDVVRLVWGTMSAGANAVLGVVYFVGGVFAAMLSQIQTGVALLMEGFAKITFGNVSAQFEKAAAEIRLSANATNASAAELERRSIAAFGAMADGAQTARNGWAGLTDSAAAGTGQLKTSQAVIASTAAELQAMAEKASAAGDEAKRAAAKQTEAAAQAAAKVAQLRAEYEAAVSADNWQLAAQKLIELRAASEQARAGVAGLGAEAKDAAAAVTAAFQAMGIKTKAELQDMADQARVRFELIKGSGQATADGVATAWKAMADAAIAANGGVATETIKAQAAMHGLQITTDAAGKNIVTAMNAGADSTQRFGGSVADARTELERMNDELERSIAIREKANELKEREAELERQRLNIDREGFGLNTAGERAVGSAMSLNEAVKQAVSKGLAEADAYRIAKDNYTAGRSVRMGGGTFDIAGGVNDSNFWAAVTRKLDEQVAQRSTYGMGESGSVRGAAQGTTTAKTYNVQVGGRTIRTASDADAQALIGALRDAQRSA